MGNNIQLSWSKGIPVKEGRLLLVKAPMPGGKETAEQLWDVWRHNKDALKKDGFSVSRDQQTGLWSICYFHELTNTSYQKTNAGVDRWREEFNRKIAKWTTQMRRVDVATAPVTVATRNNNLSREVIRDDEPIRDEPRVLCNFADLEADFSLD